MISEQDSADSDLRIPLTEQELSTAEAFRREQQVAVLVVMFSDIENSTQLLESKGEVEYTKLRRRHDELVRTVIERDSAGRCVKHLGDGFMALFAEPSTAVERSLELHEKLAQEFGLRVRIGLDMGQISIEKAGGITRDAFGRFVNRAARINAAAGGGQTYASYHVWDSAVGWLSPDSAIWCAIGDMELKGFKHPIPVYEFRSARAHAPLEIEELSELINRRSSLESVLSYPAEQVGRELIEARAKLDENLAKFQRMLAVMFVDMVGSATYFERRGEDEGSMWVRKCIDMLSTVVEHHGGIISRTIGDALMAYFENPVAGVRAAVDMQCTVHAYSESQPKSEQMRIRIGLNYGLALVKDKDVFGDVVNVAARIESMAKGSQILISESLEERIRSHDIPCCRKVMDVLIHRKIGRKVPDSHIEVGRMAICEVLWRDASIVPPLPNATAAPRSEGHPAASAHRPSESRAEKRRKLLWLDDTADKTIFARKALREQGWKVDLATVGLVRALLGSYHLIVLATASALRASRRLRFLKVIARVGPKTPVLLFTTVGAAQKLTSQTEAFPIVGCTASVAELIALAETYLGNPQTTPELSPRT